MNVIEAEGLCKRYPGSVGGLFNFSITMSAGEATAIVGPNGSGKSTLFKSMLGLVKLDGGTVRLFGQRPTGRGRSVLSRVGALLEGRANIYERLSTAENCDYYCALRGAVLDRFYMRALADRLGLEDLRVPVRRLSTGNRQRAALLCAMVHQPTLVMLDEPTLGLDRAGVLAFQDLLREQQQAGLSILTTSHDADFVAATADRVIGMMGGRCDFDRETCQHAGSPRRYRLQTAAINPLPSDVLATLCESESFAEQVRRLQELARLYPDLYRASIQPVPDIEADCAFEEENGGRNQCRKSMR